MLTEIYVCCCICKPVDLQLHQSLLLPLTVLRPRLPHVLRPYHRLGLSDTSDIRVMMSGISRAEEFETDDLG